MALGTLRLAVRLAARELRGGLRGFRVFLACLTLGVAAIAAVGSVSAAFVAGLAGDARTLLGGDVELRLVHRPATAEQRAWLERSATVSDVVWLRAMARTPDGARRSLVEIKAVDDAYPLYGTVGLEPDRPLAALLAEEGGLWGAAVDPLILERLQLKVGDTIRLGDGSFRIAAAITREPDASANAFVFGPRVMLAPGGLAATGLIQPGSLAAYEYRLRLPAGTAPGPWIEALKAAFPDAGWRIRDFNNASPAVQQFIDRVTLFLTLVGLTALLVGGVGVGNSVRAYLAGRVRTIAVLKCLGAPARLVFATYLVQVMALAGLGIAVGLALGALAPPIVAWGFGDRLPVPARVGVYPLPLLLAAAFGVLTALSFSLWPLARARVLAAATLFRDIVAPGPSWPGAGYALATAAAIAALAGLAVVSAQDRKIALWFVVGAAGTFIAFHVLAWGVAALARRAGRPPWPGLRLALANLHRPGAPTASVMLSLGLGLTVLVAIALIEGNMTRQLKESLPEAAPTFFFIDIQPDQVATFEAIVAGFPGVAPPERVPSLRGRITRLNGAPVEAATVAPEAQWAVRSERGLTYAARVPQGSRVVDGAWWPADYRGPPLVSFDADLARGMGLKVGDTMTINVLGREMTARIANLRKIEWATLGINFAIVFAPGALDGAPQTHLATVAVPPELEEPLQRAVTERLPNVSAIRVKDALQRVADLVAKIGEAVRLTAGVTLLAGTLVLAGAIAAGHRRRVYDAVVLKVLGATRLDVTRAFLLEYGLLGLVTAAVAAVIGSIAAWLVLTQVMRAEWTFLPGAVLATAVLATAITVVAGLAGTWRALGARAAPLLRND